MRYLAAIWVVWCFIVMGFASALWMLTYLMAKAQEFMQ